jgi:hypothetical protein
VPSGPSTSSPRLVKRVPVTTPQNILAHHGSHTVRQPGQGGSLNNEDATLIKDLLSQCWHELEGAGETSMAAYKLGRAEQLSWYPPCLSLLPFTSRRQGVSARQARGIYFETLPSS